jgi:hypothetical protein
VLRLGLVSGLLFALIVVAFSPAASADPWGSVDCSQSPGGTGCDVGAGQGGHNGESAGGSGGSVHVDGNAGGSGDGFQECRHVPVDHQDPAGQPPGAGGWYMVLCSPDGKDPLSHGPVWIAAGAGGAPAVSPEQLAQLARKRLRLPQPRIAASPAADQLVNLPMWLWLNEGWRQVSASASVPGVSVTAVAKPTSVSWSMGDRGSVECAGPGTPHRPDVDPRSPSPDCGYVYRRSSAAQPGQTYQVMATIRWTVTWSGAGQSGVFPGLTTSATTAYRVAESQALNTG